MRLVQRQATSNLRELHRLIGRMDDKEIEETLVHARALCSMMLKLLLAAHAKRELRLLRLGDLVAAVQP